MTDKSVVDRRKLLVGIPTVAGAVAFSFPSNAPSAKPLSRRTIQSMTAEGLSSDERTRHERYMAMAFDLAKKGAAPFGAVIVHRESGNVVCKGRNQGDVNPIYHGEIDAIINCGRLKPPIEWEMMTLYTTGECCPMCMSAVVWAGIPEVVYGTSIKSISTFGVDQIEFNSPSVAAAAPFYEGRIIGGILKERTDPLFEAWASRLNRCKHRDEDPGGLYGKCNRAS
ncbi:MAG: nucleoside deaminase [Hyphomicrobium sp.]|nr:nucleoside deaminase [Hyphomicrobium sp.]